MAVERLMARAYIGTSGWIYSHWKDTWYKGVPRKQWLEHCASHFTGLEANGTFYRLPKKEPLEEWARRTPPEFRFAAKAHRYLTHRKKLKDISEGIEKQKEPMAGLGEKLAVVVWQLPARFSANLDRLDSFLSELAAWPEVRHAIEFRHESWFTDLVASRLNQARVANCLSDAASWPCWDAVTTDFVYVRLHGGERTYWSAYSDGELAGWARKVETWLGEGKDVHVYFDNDAKSAAPYDAVKLLGIIGA